MHREHRSSPLLKPDAARAGRRDALPNVTRRVMVREQAQLHSLLSMNRPFGVPALAGPDRLKAGLHTSGFPTDWFKVPMHAEKTKGRLSMRRIASV